MKFTTLMYLKAQSLCLAQEIQNKHLKNIAEGGNVGE